MLDTFNTERFSILFSKYVKMTTTNLEKTAQSIQPVCGGINIGGPNNQISRATRIVKFYIPGKKFARRSVLQ